SDCQHDGKQSREIDGEAERPHHGESADNSDGHGRRRNQHRAPVLQEQKDDDQNQDRRLDQSLVHFVNRGLHKDRRVEWHRISETLGKGARQNLHLRLHRVLDIERIGSRRLIDADAGSLLAVEVEILAISLGTKFDAADVAQPRDFAIAAGLDDHIFIFADIIEPPLKLDGELKINAGRRRRHANLPGSHFLALVLKRLHDILGVETARLQLVRIEPDAHRILSGAKYIDVADAGKPRQFILEVYGG